MMILTNLSIMKNKQVGSISTYGELKIAKKRLEETIKSQETEILSSPLVSIPMSILSGGSIKGTLQESMESISLDHYKKAALNLLSTILMANRRTRKFYVGFIIAKEMVPFILDKVNEYMKK